MKSNLAANLKRLRKENKLTQEQLAQAMCVTSGAVYKWEQELSTPDIYTVMDLARFFSISVDALIGYNAMNKNIEDSIKYIKKLENEKKYNKAISIAEKLIVLYPNNFEVLYNCGLLYEHYIFENVDEDNEKIKNYIEKALNLLNKAKCIIGESKNPSLDNYYIDSCIAECFCASKDFNKTIEILKKINYDGINNTRIAESLMFSGDTKSEELKKYLSNSFVLTSNSLLNSLLTILDYCDFNNDFKNSEMIIDFIIQFIESLQSNKGICYMNKCLGYLYFRKSNILHKGKKEYITTLKRAYDEVINSDKVEYYTNNDILFSFLSVDKLRMIDDIGSSSNCLIDEYIKDTKVDPDFLKQWENISKK